MPNELLDAMKNFRLRIVAIILAFSLGIASVYAIGGFSYLASQFERKTVVSETSTQTNEVLSEAISSKKESVNIPKLTYPFKDYPVTKIYKGKVAPLKLTRKEKEDIFGEKLQYTVDNLPEVNFAGHYIVATWSCGMWCDWSAIIDAKTGKVYSGDVITSHCFPDLDTDFVCNENFSNVEYRIDSKLIVFFGSRSDNEGDRGFHYHKFENGRFTHLKSVLVKEQRSTSQIMLDKHDEKTDKNKDPEK